MISPSASAQPAIITTRFAPSPTGRLHLGHAFSALVAWTTARAAGGRFLLRLEDIDPGRCRPDFADGILEDLAWLGLDWDGPVWRQSERVAVYRAALDRLTEMALLYPCFCTRADIAAEIARSGAAPHGPEGALYPGLCRGLPADEIARRAAEGQPMALRLDMARAVAMAPALSFHDATAGTVVADPAAFGDIVLARKDAPTSYHLAVTVDDAAQGVTLVTRGVDLLPATHVHRMLQALLDLPTPAYAHHQLLTDGNGRRLAKRDQAATLAALRAAGADPTEVRRDLGF